MMQAPCLQSHLQLACVFLLVPTVLVSLSMVSLSLAELGLLHVLSNVEANGQQSLAGRCCCCLFDTINYGAGTG
jgi:hypothetical protein